MSNKKHFAFILFTVSIIMFLALTTRVIIVNGEIDKTKHKIEKKSYLDKYDLSLVDFDNIDEELNKIEEEILNKEITINVNGADKKVTLKDIGVELDKETIKYDIIEYERTIDYYDKYSRESTFSYDIKKYDLKYRVNEETIKTFLSDLKKEVDKTAKKGRLEMDNKTRELKYVDEVIGFTLDVDKSFEAIRDSISENEYTDYIKLVGTSNSINDIYKTINYKVSSFTTEFDTKVSRKHNLATAVKGIDGVILKPGEIFSYYKTAGPYTKKGYVYYAGVKGNGVCQVATTLYNAELLAGLQTINRYSHPDKPKYVPGGLDTAVSTTKTFNADFRFKNTYKYPLYISAFINGGKLTVEIWSNENATNGVTYKTRSVRKAYASYDAYREHYKDGKKIKDEYLGHSWYKTEIQ